MKYEFLEKLEPESSHGKLLSQVKPGSTVLECGCAGGYMTKYMQQMGCRVYIVEQDREGFDSAIAFAEDGVCGDLTEQSCFEKFSGLCFDHILFSDVLEHLSDPLDVVRRACSLLKEDGTVLVSLPNIGHNDILLKLWEGKWNYTPLGLLDDTHIRFWGLQDLDSFFEKASLCITVKDYTFAPTTRTEQYAQSSELQFEGVPLAIAHRPAGEIYQFILTLQKQSYVRNAGVTPVDKLADYVSVEKNGEYLLAELRRKETELHSMQLQISRLNDWLEESRTQARNQNVLIELQKNQLAELDQQKELVRLLEDQKAQASDREAQLQADGQYFLDEYLKAINARNALQQQLAHYQMLYNEISGATFWRITKPFRVLTDWIVRVMKSTRVTYLLGKGVKSLLRDGIRVTWKKTKRVLSKKPNFLDVTITRYSEEDLKKQRDEKFPRDVRFSVLVPLYNTPKRYLKHMIESVQEQTYRNWELCLADGSDKKHKCVGRISKRYARRDKRIRYQKLEQNLGISGNTNACIDMATGDFISLFDHDDLLHPAALYEKMKAICEKDADMVYTDETTFHEDPTDAFYPHLKPDYAPDTLRANNYICHFTSFKRSLLEEVGPFNPEYDGSQDFDMMLRLTEKAHNIVHIPKILYYWRAHKNSVADSVGAKPYVLNAAKSAILAHMERVGLKGEILDTVVPSIYRIRYALTSEPLVSILIPNYEHKADLELCLNSIFEKTTYSNFEIIIIENNSSSKEIFDYYEQIQKKWSNVKVVVWDSIFNYSAINNFGAKFARGEHLLLLNNDTEVISPDWLQEMLMFSQRNDVGAVGVKLYYGDDTIQHAGVGLGLLTLAGHLHRNFGRNEFGYMGRLVYAQNLSVVTAACMMIRRDVWDEVGGLDESFEVAFNDVDLCMRIRKAKYLIVWTPFAELYHHESKSRGLDSTPQKQRRFLGEVSRFQTRWAKELAEGDPYYNPNLSLDNERFEIIY